jgi:uncharacterized RDD family membrane protein YckC
METSVFPENQNQPVAYAGFWLRFGALIIDTIIMYVIQLIIITPFLALIGLKVAVNEVDPAELSDEDKLAFVFSMLPALMMTWIAVGIAGWLYYSLMESSDRQATIGKIAVGIKVTDMQGDKITFGRASGRYFSKIISGLLLCFGYLMAAFTEKRQALHDLIANTLVVKR